MFSIVSGDPVQKRMTFLPFFTSLFQNLLFFEILWLTSRKKNTHQKQIKFLFTEKTRFIQEQNHTLPQNETC